MLEAACAFVERLGAREFDSVPPNRAHMADARYQVAGYLGDVGDIYEQPYWRLFAGSCIGHCRGHPDELELGLSLIRRQMPPPRG